MTKSDATNDESTDSADWSGRKILEVGLRVASNGFLANVPLNIKQAQEVLSALSEPRTPADYLRGLEALLADYFAAYPAGRLGDRYRALKDNAGSATEPAASPVSETGKREHTFSPAETDRKLLHAWTDTHANYPPYFNLTMLRMHSAVVLTVRLPTKDGKTEGATASVRFTREMWREFIRQLPEANKVFEAADYLDAI